MDLRSGTRTSAEASRGDRKQKTGFGDGAPTLELSSRGSAGDLPVSRPEIPTESGRADDGIDAEVEGRESGSPDDRTFATVAGTGVTTPAQPSPSRTDQDEDSARAPATPDGATRGRLLGKAANSPIARFFPLGKPPRVTFAKEVSVITLDCTEDADSGVPSEPRNAAFSTEEEDAPASQKEASPEPASQKEEDFREVRSRKQKRNDRIQVALVHESGRHVPFTTNSKFYDYMYRFFRRRISFRPDEDARGLTITLTSAEELERFPFKEVHSLFQLVRRGERSARPVRGVIRSVPEDATERMIVEYLGVLGVSSARRMYRTTAEGKRLPLGTVVLEFGSGSALPRTVRLGHLDRDVHPYITPPPQCWKCGRFGHIQRRCRSTPRCVNCAGPHTVDKCSPKPVLRCANCGGPHGAAHPSCPTRQKVLGTHAEQLRDRYRQARVQRTQQRKEGEPERPARKDPVKAIATGANAERLAPPPEVPKPQRERSAAPQKAEEPKEATVATPQKAPRRRIRKRRRRKAANPIPPTERSTESTTEPKEPTPGSKAPERTKDGSDLEVVSEENVKRFRQNAMESTLSDMFKHVAPRVLAVGTADEHAEALFFELLKAMRTSEQEFAMYQRSLRKDLRDHLQFHLDSAWHHIFYVYTLHRSLGHLTEVGRTFTRAFGVPATT